MQRFFFLVCVLQYICVPPFFFLFWKSDMMVVDMVFRFITSKSVHLVLHPHGIETTFLKLDSRSSGAGFYFYYIHQENKSDKERKIARKKMSFMHTKRFNTFFKRWVRFRVGAIPRLPFNSKAYFLVHGIGKLFRSFVFISNCLKFEKYV